MSPGEIEDYALEELTFEYDADELGLKDEEAEKLKDGTIRQLRPLPGGQPFGIFFVEFGQARLPVVVLRCILNALVHKKRNSANPADRQRWDADDLLFISDLSGQKPPMASTPTTTFPKSATSSSDSFANWETTCASMP